MGKPVKNSTAVFTTAEIREIEQLAAVPGGAPGLMEKAGLAAAEVARDELLIDGRAHVLVLAGPGNNGGDALVIARHLREWWFNVTLVFTGEASGQSPDASGSVAVAAPPADAGGAGGIQLPVWTKPWAGVV